MKDKKDPKGDDNFPELETDKEVKQPDVQAKKSFADKHSPKQSDNDSMINDDLKDIDTSAADGSGAPGV